MAINRMEKPFDSRPCVRSFPFDFRFLCETTQVGRNYGPAKLGHSSMVDRTSQKMQIKVVILKNNN